MILIYDYGIGNTGSISNMIKKIGLDSEVSSDVSLVSKAKFCIIPGVGSFDACITEFNKQESSELLLQRISSGLKTLGICVGMQMLFEKSEENKSEIIPNTNFSNPFKQIYFKYIIRQDPYSLEAVEDLLKKFKKNVHLIKGNSNSVLKKIDMSKVDYVFLDGGHDYNTVKNDLNCCSEVIDNNGTILCDDYNLAYAPGVKKAIDEYVENNNYKCEILRNYRFAKIEKK